VDTIFPQFAELPKNEIQELSIRSPLSRSNRPRWRVDRIHSHILGRLLSNPLTPQRFHPLVGSREWQTWAELVTVTICHQANWDKLHARVIELASEDVKQLSPPVISQISGAEFRRLFGIAYDETRLRMAERAGLLRSLGTSVVNEAGSPIFDWLNSSPVYLGGSRGLYRWLNNIKAFAEDPLQKKTRMFVHSLLQFGLIAVADPENIQPAVDYHLIRLYVRTGRVLPAQADLLDRLTSEGTPRVEFHTELRAAVEEAMFYTASGAGIRIDELNHIEWQIARSFCVRKNARCNGPALPEKPVDEFVNGLAIKACGCPMRSDCRGAVDEVLRSIVDPRSASSYY
jgi:hypothetical protein